RTLHYSIEIDISFFFSSRRRHTRFKCDWSSDVCSSDLITTDNRTKGPVPPSAGGVVQPLTPGVDYSVARAAEDPSILEITPLKRSEERRVGKESRFRRMVDGSGRKKWSEVEV